MSKNTFITKYMKILLPIISKINPNTQKESIIDSLYKIDNHNHTQDKGRRVTPAGITIDGDLSFRDIENVKEFKLSNITEIQIGQSFYLKNGDFYTTNEVGEEIQLTEGGSFATGTGDVIGGDYQSSNAEVIYDSASETYFFTKQAGENANISVKDLTLKAFNNEIITLKVSPTLTDDYNLTLPEDASEVPSVLGITLEGQIYTLKHEALDNESLLLAIDNEYIVSPVRLVHFPFEELNKYKIISVTGVNNVDNSDVGIKLPLLTALNVDNDVEGLIGVFDNKIRLFTNQWYELFTTEVEEISFNDIIDVEITNPQNLEYFSYDEDLKKFSNKTYPDIDYTDIKNKPNDITDLSQHNLKELSDVSSVGWNVPSNNGHVLRWNSIFNEFRLSPDGGDFALWGTISGDITTNSNVMNTSNTYLDAHNPIIHLTNLDSVFNLKDVDNGLIDLIPTPTQTLLLVWRKDDPLSEVDFNGKFVLEPFSPSSPSPFKEGGLKGQLYSFNEGVVTGLPVESNLVSYTTFPVDLHALVCENIGGVPILRHRKVSEIKAGGGIALITKLEEVEAGSFDSITIPTTIGSDYFIEIVNKGSSNVVIEYNGEGLGCLPNNTLQKIIVNADGSNIKITTTSGFTKHAYVYVLPTTQLGV